MKLVADRFGVAESMDDSYKTALDQMRANPELKGILAFGSQGPIGAARAVEERGKEKNIAVVGPFSPGQGAKYIKSGAIREGYIWNPMLAGEVIVYVGDMLAKGKAPNDGMDIPGLGAVHGRPGDPQHPGAEAAGDQQGHDRRAGRHGPLTHAEGAPARRPRRWSRLAPFLRLTAVSKRFGGVLALDRIDWDVLPGRGALPGRRERLRQVHADQARRRRACARPGQPDRARGRGARRISTRRWPRRWACRSSSRTCRCSRTCRWPRTSPSTRAWAGSPGRCGAAGCARWRGDLLARLGFDLQLDAAVASLSIAERQVVAICRAWPPTPSCCSWTSPRPR